MSRPHIEFIHAVQLPWQGGYLERVRPGLAGKTLSCDVTTGALTALLRYPPAWRHDGPVLTASEELFVLSGEIMIAGERYGRHHYGYRPRGHGATLASPDGAIVLTMFDADPVAGAAIADNDGPAVHVDAFALPWDMAGMDAGVRYLRMGRKNLRLGPNDSGRTYLLAGMAQSTPPNGCQAFERHPYAEEGFMISGDLALSNGVMRQSAYFWRPPGGWHGGMGSTQGFLMLIRTPGSNVPIIEWSQERHAVSLSPPHRPILSDDMTDLGPLADPLDY